MQLRFSLFDFATPEYDQAVKLRYDILRVPLGISFEVKDLAKEYDQIHMGAYLSDGTLAACLSFQAYGENILKMRQVATKESLQGKGIGKALVAFSENWARENGVKKFVVHAREVAVPFYEKMDYTKIGKRFEEVNIPHFKMEKNF